MNRAPFEQPSTQDQSLKGTQADNFVGSDFEFVAVLWLVVKKDYFQLQKCFDSANIGEVTMIQRKLRIRRRFFFAS
jgi:hypothetical protein